MEEQLLRQILSEMAEFKTEMAQLKNELGAEIADVKSEIADVKSEIADVRSEIADVRSEITDVRSEIKDVKSEITDMKSDIKVITTRLDRVEQLQQAIFEEVGGLMEFKTKVLYALDDIKDDQASIHEILGRHDSEISTIRRKISQISK